MNGQLHARHALLPDEEALVLVEFVWGGSGRFREEKKLLPLSGMECCALDNAFRIVVTIPPELSWLVKESCECVRTVQFICYDTRRFFIKTT